MLTGITNANPLVNYLSSNGFAFEHLNFKDHHNFTKNELSSINSKNLVLTTEKDFMRLKDSLKSDKLYYLPIETGISESSQFDQLIRRFIKI